MDKQIFVLEPSPTVKKLLEEGFAQKQGCTVKFIPNGLSLLWALAKEIPDALLINAKTKNPGAMELVRLIKSISKASGVAVGMYATGSIAFADFYAKNCGADFFIPLNEKTLQDSVEKIIYCANKGASAPLIQNDGIKNAITQKLMDLLRSSSSLKDLAQRALDCIAEFCEAPLATLIFMDDGTPQAYYMASASIEQKKADDFLRVSMADFEQDFPNANYSVVKPQKVQVSTSLGNFYTGIVPLSSYHRVPLFSTEKKCIGSLHIVKEGNLSLEQEDLLSFCMQRVSLVLENALSIKKQKVFEKQIRTAFSRFVPEQIIDDLVKEAGSVNKIAIGEKRAVVILFSDIRSFTSISERNKPETIVAFLNRYFTIMVNAIKKHGGTIDKFIGDAIMALFGAPVSYEDNVSRALAAAVEMRALLPTVPLEDLVLPEGMKFNIGIGIHYGDVTVGSIGSSDKMDYTVIGDNVNLASRLEGLTKTYGTMIVVSESVKKEIRDESFSFRHLDNVKVKGKEKSVPIYALDSDDTNAEYRDYYDKGLNLYIEGIWKLAKEYFQKALSYVPGDKAAELMLSRCDEFIENPPQNWDGAITFHTK